MSAGQSKRFANEMRPIEGGFDGIGAQFDVEFLWVARINSFGILIEAMGGGVGPREARPDRRNRRHRQDRA